MTSAPQARTLARVVSTLVVATFGLLVFGSTVRVHGAGLACPDWPLCFGQVVPQLDFHVWLEFGHRALAGVIGLAWLGVGIAIARDAVLRRRFLAHWALGLVALCGQAVLGGLTVLHLLAEWTVASHLLGGNGFCLLAFLLALRLREAAAPARRSEVRIGDRAFGGVIAALVVLQLAIGGFVSSSGAGLACGAWPGCNGPAWFPTFQGLVGLQVTHRLVAYLLFGVLILGAISARGAAVRPARLLLGLGVVQLSLGVANVLLHLPVEVTLLHSAGAAAIVLGATWLNFEAWSAPLAPLQVDVRVGAPVEAR